MKSKFITLACLATQLFCISPENTGFDFNKSLHSQITEKDLTPQAPILQPSYKSGTVAAGLSLLIPGLGHVYLGDLKTAGGFYGSFVLGSGAAKYAYNTDNEDLYRSSNTMTQNLYMYNIYAAYRDARLHNGTSGYKYKMPTETLVDLTYAPFQWSVIKKPEVWGGVLGALAVASTVMYFGYSTKSDMSLSSSPSPLMPLLAFPVGIGEEALFRGYLQSTLTESCTPWGGLALSSLAFGAVHIPNAQVLPQEERWRYYSFSLPLITGMGAYMGWLSQKNHSLKESVAVHAWYDFTLFAISAASYSASTGNTGFAAEFSF